MRYRILPKMNFTPGIQPPAAGSDEAWHFVFVEGKLLLPEAEPAALAPLPAALFGGPEIARHYLGRLDGHDCWTHTLGHAPAGWRPTLLRAAMLQMPRELMGLAGRAAQIIEWERTHRFCGVCGTATELQAGERARRCPACKHTAYPRLSPAMMVLVQRGRELLLARSPHYPAGMYSALAGFVEAGESLEECVHREVAEEVGVRVTNLRYYGSQSWPFPHSLMLAFTADWVGGEIARQVDEIEDARWFDIDALPGIPPRFSVAGHLIRDTVDRLRA